MRFRLPWRREQARGTRVVPRALTLGVYLQALSASDRDDGAIWDAATAPMEECLAVLDALSEEVVLPPKDVGSWIRARAGEAWARLELERDRANARVARLTAAASRATGESPADGGRRREIELERGLSRLGFADYAAALSLPLERALVRLAVGAIVSQADEIERQAKETAMRRN